ncbi:MAG: hypothetical protein AAF358_22860 [Pseudomonadota bacterium]
MMIQKTTVATALLVALSTPVAFAQDPAAPAESPRTSQEAAKPRTTAEIPQRLVVAEADQTLVVIDDRSGTLGRIEPPTRLGEPNALQAVDPTKVGVTQFVRFEDADDRPRPSRDGSSATSSAASNRPRN